MERLTIKNILLFVTGILIGIALGIVINTCYPTDVPCSAAVQPVSQGPAMPLTSSPVIPDQKSPFTPKQFAFSDVTFLSPKQIEDHLKLYKGYVDRLNEIDKELKSADRKKANNVTFSPFRGLKVAQTYALNGMTLHELYFENLAGGKKIQPTTQALLEKHFGSLDAFKDDLIACARSARGWVVCGYNVSTQQVCNYVLDAHNELVPVLVLPLLVVDVYEHAYMIDYGIERPKYLDGLWNTIDWDVVDARVKSFIHLEILK